MGFFCLTSVSCFSLIPFCDSCASGGVLPLHAGFCTLAESSVGAGSLTLCVCVCVYERGRFFFFFCIDLPFPVFYPNALAHLSNQCVRRIFEYALLYNLHAVQLCVNAFVCKSLSGMKGGNSKMKENVCHSSKKMLVGLCFFFAVFRKEQSILSPVNCWNLLLLQVKRESRDHATLSDLYLNNIIPRFAQISEDSGRLFKKVMMHNRMTPLQILLLGFRVGIRSYGEAGDLLRCMCW